MDTKNAFASMARYELESFIEKRVQELLSNLNDAGEETVKLLCKLDSPSMVIGSVFISASTMYLAKSMAMAIYHDDSCNNDIVARVKLQELINKSSAVISQVVLEMVNEAREKMRQLNENL